MRERFLRKEAGISDATEWKRLIDNLPKENRAQAINQMITKITTSHYLGNIGLRKKAAEELMRAIPFDYWPRFSLAASRMEAARAFDLLPKDVQAKVYGILQKEFEMNPKIRFQKDVIEALEKENIKVVGRSRFLLFSGAALGTIFGLLLPPLYRDMGRWSRESPPGKKVRRTVEHAFEKRRRGRGEQAVRDAVRRARQDREKRGK